jgi:plasmid stabilization system protein ParE
MRLEWSQLAQADRDAIFDYIEADSPQAAVTVDDRIRVQVEGLIRFPESGRPGARRKNAGTGHSRHALHCRLSRRSGHRADFACVARCPAVARGYFGRTARVKTWTCGPSAAHWLIEMKKSTLNAAVRTPTHSQATRMCGAPGNLKIVRSLFHIWDSDLEE